MEGKNIKGFVKLQLSAGKANPSPPIGPALGQHGVNIMDFCRRFNDATKDSVGTIIPVEITIYEDRTFDFILKSPPAAVLLLKEAGLEKGSPNSLSSKVGKVDYEALKRIAVIKQKDLNAVDLEGAVRIIAGTARSLGIECDLSSSSNS